MRYIFAGLLLYGLFIIQSYLTVWGPDLVLLAVAVFALHEERLAAVLLGVWAGLCLDLAAPPAAGVHLAAFALTAWFGPTIRNHLYRSTWSATLHVVIGIGLKWVLLMLNGHSRVELLPWIVSSGTTVILSPFFARLLGRVYYRRWQLV